MSSTEDSRQQAMRVMYETLPFPQRGGDHAVTAKHLAAELLRAGAPDRGKWLDIGCGTGELLVEFARAMPEMQVHGFDYSEASVELGRSCVEASGLQNASVVWGDMTADGWADGTWDIVSALGSIHHIANPDLGFDNAVKAIRPGGFFALYFYGAYGRYDRTLKQELLRKFAPDPQAFQDRIELAKRMFNPELGTSEPMSDVWIADQYAHPCERSYTLGEVLDMFDRNGLELVAWLNVLDEPEQYFADTEICTRFRDLGRREQLEVLDLHLRMVDNTVIALKVG